MTKQVIVTTPHNSGLGDVAWSAFEKCNGNFSELYGGLIQTSAEIAAGVTPVNLAYQPYDLRRYGADPTGAVASDAAMVSAIAVCGTAGGTIRAPNGVYKFANQINLNQKSNITIQGDGCTTGGALMATQFQYTGTGSGIWILMNSAVGCSFRGVQLVHTNAGFTGTYIQCNNDGTHGDPPFCGLYDCTVGSSAGGVGNLHLDLNKCICWTAERCNFIYGNPSVRGAQAGGYAVAIKFRDCHFVTQYVAPIWDGGQAWSFTGCVFESLITGAPGALFSSSSSRIFNGIVIEGCWFGDAGTTAGTWLDIYGEALSFKGNLIGGNTTGSTAIVLRSFFGAEIVANNFDQHLVGINFATGPCANILVEANVFNSVTTPSSGGANVTVGTLDWKANYGGPIPSGHGSLAANGYMVEPTGLIRQWGSVAVTTGTPVTVTFAANGIAFPTACWNVVISLIAESGANSAFASSIGATSFVANVAGTAGANTVHWRAIGN